MKHEILDGYEVRCSIDSCYVCTSGYLETMGYDFVVLAIFLFRTYSSKMYISVMLKVHAHKYEGVIYDSGSFCSLVDISSRMLFYCM